METWKQIVVHCSDSTFGSASMIRKWHLQKGWSDIGYHYVINNGHLASGLYLPEMDGGLEVGRVMDGDSLVEQGEQGAHVLGHNKDSIGICLIGKGLYTPKQQETLIALVKRLQIRFGISSDDVRGHSELDETKTCPMYHMALLRTQIYRIHKEVKHG